MKFDREKFISQTAGSTVNSLERALDTIDILTKIISGYVEDDIEAELGADSGCYGKYADTVIQRQMKEKNISEFFSFSA